MMRINSRSKAVALLLLVSLQYSFAIVDVALCSKALCYPKTSGAKYGAVSKNCPDGFELGKDAAGKAVCTKRVAKPCPEGTTLKNGKCCGTPGTSKQCVPMPGYTSFSCPTGYTAMKDCDSTGATSAAAAGQPQVVEADVGRKLLTGNPLVKEVNIVGTRIIPNVILPKPAISFNMPPLKAKQPPKINLPSLQIPQIILPEPAVSINVPKIPKVTPEIKFDGHPSFLPNIIPILPEPKITIDAPIGALPKPFPTINTNISTKVVTVDLSNAGPSHTAEVNLPSFPNLKDELFKIPDIDVKLPQLPKVIDLSALGPKKSVNLTLPELKLPSAGSLTIKNDGANEPQFLDLSGVVNKILGKNASDASKDTNFNIVLPKIATEGATLNLVLDNKDVMKDITLPGHGGKHNTIINVPGWDKQEMPSKNAKLTVDLSANTNGLLQKVDQLNALAKDKKVEKVDIALPDVDLSKIHKGLPDVVVDVKPLISFNKSNVDLLSADDIKKNGLAGIGGKGGNTRVNVTMKDIEIPKLMKDATIVVKPKEFDLTKFLPKSLLNKTDDGSISTTTTINLPEHSLPVLPVPKGKTDIDVSVPLKVGGLLKHLDSSKAPDATLNVKYQEEWTGGNATLPNPGSKVANFIGKAVNAVTAASCPTKCCKEVELAGGCQAQEFEIETVPVQFTCEAGCTYDLKNDKCLCNAGTVAECPAGLSKCSIAGKGVCAPDVNGLVGLDACAAFKAVCSKVGVVAKSCQ